MSDFRIFEYEINTAKLPAGTKGPVFCMLADLHNKSYGGELTFTISMTVGSVKGAQTLTSKACGL